MERWGADLYGDPCRECGFGWELSPAQAIAWTQSAEVALAGGVVLRHVTRGAQAAEDVARNNTHDAHHHLWDIDRTLARH